VRKTQVTRRQMLQGSALAAAEAVIGPKRMWAQTNAPVATTTSGKVRGFVQDGVNVFKGISYGDDTARHRFMPPAKPQPWTGVMDALKFGPQAPQPIHARSGRSAFSPLDEANPVNSEDCLHLNIWTAGLRDGRKRPVMVYIHGGAYSSSSSNGPVYDGVCLVKRGDVVVVTMNHRLNLFGYMYLAKLGGSEFADSGNVGQLDLILMLEWVRDNIAEFGGDPNTVMIFGQSGGGRKVATLLAISSTRRVTRSRKSASHTPAEAVLRSSRLR